MINRKNTRITYLHEPIEITKLDIQKRNSIFSANNFDKTEPEVLPYYLCRFEASHQALRVLDELGKFNYFLGCFSFP